MNTPRNGYSKEENRLKQRIYDRDTEIVKLEELLVKRNAEIREINKKLKSLETNIVLTSTNKDTIKRILLYKSKNDSFREIYEKLKYNAIHVEIEYIKEICVNYEELDNELVLYYKEQRNLFEEQLQLNPEVLKDSLVQKYQMLINDASMDLLSVIEVEEKRKIREEINKHLDKLNNVLKNIVEDNKPEDRSITILNETMSEYEDNVSNIVKLRVNREDIRTINSKV